MIEFEYDDRGNVYVEEFGRVLEEYGPMSERAMASAQKSTGWYLKEAMKTAIHRQGEPAGSWPARNLQGQQLTKATNSTGSVKNWKTVWRGKNGKRRRGRQYWSERPTIQRTIRQTGRNEMALLRLAGGLRYEYDDATGVMSVGFVNAKFKVQKFLEHQAGGGTTRITPKMRRFAFAMGMPIAKHKHFLHTPARPLVGPVWKAEKETALERLEDKFFKALVRYQDEKVAA